MTLEVLRVIMDCSALNKVFGRYLTSLGPVLYSVYMLYCTVYTSVCRTSINQFCLFHLECSMSIGIENGVYIF